MNEKHKLQYNDPFSLLVVCKDGTIRKIYTPFLVECIISTKYIKSGDRVNVSRIEEERSITMGLTIMMIIFIVNDVKFSHNYFKILS